MFLNEKSLSTPFTTLYDDQSLWGWYKLGLYFLVAGSG